MAQYKTKEDLLKAVLGDYYGLGFRLLGPDDDIVELCYCEKCIARFNQRRVTISILQKSYQNYLDNLVTKAGGN